MIDETKRWRIFRSAISGKFVSRAYAEANPTTTVAVTVTQKVKCDD